MTEGNETAQQSSAGKQPGDIPSSTEQTGSAAGPPEKQPVTNAAPADDDDDDDESCGFCIFMKAGGCKDVFKSWSKCVDSERQAGGDFANDCREQTFALRECMLKNREYYAPVLEEEADFVADKEEAGKS